jgi:adenylate cyclase class IV
MRSLIMKFKEIEYKYKADNITPGQFVDFVSSNFDIIDILTARGHDQFFSNGDPNSFLRYRNGAGMNDNCEITIKKKTSDHNSWDRIEVDLPLNKNKCSQDIVEAFTDILGYKYAFQILKLNYVIRTPGVTFAYYIVNNSDTYLEIEVNKGSFDNEDEAFQILNVAEKKLAALGLSHSNRTKKSLYEMYRGSNVQT